MKNDTITGFLDNDISFSLPDENDEHLSEVIKTVLYTGSFDDAAELLESGDTANEKETMPSLTNNKEKAKCINDFMRFFSKNVINVDSYYDFVDEYYGVVESIDNNSNEFCALFKSAHDTSYAENIVATFKIDDIQESDKELLCEGAQVVWLLGKERKINNVKGIYKLGGITNFSKIQLRRTRVLNKNQRKRVEEQVDEWGSFFAGLE